MSRREFEEQARIATGGHEALRRCIRLELVADEQFSTFDASEAVVAIGKVCCSAVQIENAARAGQSFDLAPPAWQSLQ